jgi:signal peptidase I
MSVHELNRTKFRTLVGEILKSGNRVRFQANGGSMQPFIRNNDILEVASLDSRRIKCGDVLLVETGEGRLLVHRVAKIDHRDGISNYLITGDNSSAPDGWYRSENILGRLEVVERGTRRIKLTSFPQQWRARFWVTVAPLLLKFSWLPEWFRKLLRYWLLVR